MHDPTPGHEPEGTTPARRGDAADWDVVLRKAEEAAETAAPAAPRAPAPPSAADKWKPWLRAAVPLAILIGYGGYKLFMAAPRSPRGPELVESTTLTGVKPDTARLQIDKQTQVLVAELERHKNAGDWAAILAAVAAAPPEMQSNPAVEAFSLVARVERGDQGGQLLARILALRPIFAANDKQRPMADYLALMEAELWLRTVKAPEDLTRQTDTFRALVGSQPDLTPRVLKLRIKLAERFEEMGDRERQRAGSLRKDTARLVAARALYQQALKWVTTREGWLQCQPVESGRAAAMVDALLIKIRDTNKDIHGITAPWGKGDNTTWTGLKGEPVHDRPGGEW